MRLILQARQTITHLVVGNNIEDVIIKLQNASLTLFQWFYDNQMKANPDKCHFICSTDDKVNITIENQKIYNSPCEKLLGVRFDSKLTFDTHIKDICKKAGLKLNALARITPYMDLNKKRFLLNTFLCLRLLLPVSLDVSKSHKK